MLNIDVSGVQPEKYCSKSAELRREAEAARARARQHMALVEKLEEVASLYESIAFTAKNKQAGHTLVVDGRKPTVRRVAKAVLDANGGQMVLRDIYAEAQRLGYPTPWPRENFEAQLYSYKMRSKLDLRDGILFNFPASEGTRRRGPDMRKQNSLRHKVRNAIRVLSKPVHFTDVMRSMIESGDIPDTVTERQFRDPMYSVARELALEGVYVEIRNGVIIPTVDAHIA